MWITRIVTDILRFFIEKPPRLIIAVVVIFLISLAVGDYSILMGLIIMFIAYVVPIASVFWILVWLYNKTHPNNPIEFTKKTKEPQGKSQQFSQRQAQEQTAKNSLKSENNSKKDWSAHGFIFGEINGRIMAKPEDKDGHILVIGNSGSGKSSCIAIPTLLSWEKRTFVIDIKGELYEKTKHKGKDVRIFNPLDENASGYNPFYLLNSVTKGRQVQEAQAISNALIPMPKDTSKPFWIDSARNLLTSAILHFYNLGFSFIETIEKVVETPKNKLVDEISVSQTKSVASFINAFVNMPNETLSGVYSTLHAHIVLFNTDEDVKKSLSKSNYITPETLEKEDVFITIPQAYLERWRNLLTLLVTQFLTYFEMRDENNQSLTPILFLLDEFPQLGKIDKITGALATLRSKKITIAVIVQDLCQLDEIYGEKVKGSIYGNCDYKAILNAMDNDTQKYLSESIGTHKQLKITKNKNFEPYTKFQAGSGIHEAIEDEIIVEPSKLAMIEDIALLCKVKPYFCWLKKRPYYKNE